MEYQINHQAFLMTWMDSKNFTDFCNRFPEVPTYVLNNRAVFYLERGFNIKILEGFKKEVYYPEGSGATNDSIQED